MLVYWRSELAAVVILVLDVEAQDQYGGQGKSVIRVGPGPQGREAAN
jgi:hypothetical protein